MEGKLTGATVHRTCEAMARDLGFILRWESSGGKRGCPSSSIPKGEVMGQDSQKNGGPVLTSFLAGVAGRGSRVEAQQ